MATRISEEDLAGRVNDVKILFNRFCYEIQTSESTEVLLKNVGEIWYILSRLHTLHMDMEYLGKEIEHTKDVLMVKKLLEHSEIDVRISVASCIGEVIRLSVPNQPITDDQMKVFFKLANTAYETCLPSTTSKAYFKTLSILEAVSNSCCCVLMLDLGLDSETQEMFHLFLDNIRSKHSKDTFSSMTNIMSLVIQQSWDCDNLSVELISIIISRLKKEKQNAFPRAFTLAKKVFENCANYIKTYLPEAIGRLKWPVEQYDNVVQSLYKQITQKDTKKSAEDSSSGQRRGPLLKRGFLGSKKHSEKGKQSASKALDSESSAGSYKVYGRRNKKESTTSTQKVDIGTNASCPIEVDETTEESSSSINPTNDSVIIINLTKDDEISDEIISNQLMALSVDGENSSNHQIDDDKLNKNDPPKRRIRTWKPKYATKPEEGYDHQWVNRRNRRKE